MGPAWADSSYECALPALSRPVHEDHWEVPKQVSQAPRRASSNIFHDLVLLNTDFKNTRRNKRIDLKNQGAASLVTPEMYPEILEKRSLCWLRQSRFFTETPERKGFRRRSSPGSDTQTVRGRRCRRARVSRPHLRGHSNRAGSGLRLCLYAGDARDDQPARSIEVNGGGSTTLAKTATLRPRSQTAGFTLGRQRPCTASARPL